MYYTNFRFFLICPPKPLVYKFTENTFTGERDNLFIVYSLKKT